MRIRWILVVAAALFLAYVCGRAVGIVFDLNSYVTEAIALVLVLTAGV